VSGLPSGVTASFSVNPLTPVAYGKRDLDPRWTFIHLGDVQNRGASGRPLLPRRPAHPASGSFGKRFLRTRAQFLARTMMLAAGLLFLIWTGCLRGQRGNQGRACRPGTPYTITWTATSAH